MKAHWTISMVAQSLLTLHACCYQSCLCHSEAALLRQHMSPIATIVACMILIATTVLKAMAISYVIKTGAAHRSYTFGPI